jgi:hypothetical protein
MRFSRKTGDQRFAVRCDSESDRRQEGVRNGISVPPGSFRTFDDRSLSLRPDEARAGSPVTWKGGSVVQPHDLSLAELLLAEPEVVAWLEPDERDPADDEHDKAARSA